jgi:hypothetical protein
MGEETEQGLVDSRCTTKYLHGLRLLDIDVVYYLPSAKKYIILDD